MKNKLLKSIIFSTILLFCLACFMFFKINELPKKNSLSFKEPFNLISHEGKSISEKVLASKPTVLFFGFTNCPEVCPTTLYEISSWIKELELSNNQIQVLFITLDPNRDTAPKLDEYLSNFEEKFIGLTGDEKDITELAKAWGIYRKFVPIDDDYTIDHTSTIFLINKDKTIMGTIAYREASEVAISKIRNLIKKNLN